MPERSLQGTRLPAPPLACLVARLENSRTQESACKRAGISDRTLRDWLAGSRPTVKFDTADKVLVRLGLAWWEVWTAQNTTPEALEDVAYAFTGERPGQGEQLELAA